MQISGNWALIKNFAQRNTVTITVVAELLRENVYRYNMSVSHNGVEITGSVDTDLTNDEYVDFDNSRTLCDIYGEP